MITASGLFCAIALAIFWSRIVLPVRGAATINPRWPLPIGQNKSITRVLISSALVSSTNRPVGKSGVRLSNITLSLALSGSNWFTLSTLSNAKNRSLSFGGRT